MDIEKEIEDDLDKTARPEVTEASLRRAMRVQVRGQHRNQKVSLKGESIGLACQLTGISDPVDAIDALVEDALIRWARLKMLDSVVEQGEVSEEPSHKKVISQSQQLSRIQPDDDHEDQAIITSSKS